MAVSCPLRALAAMTTIGVALVAACTSHSWLKKVSQALNMPIERFGSDAMAEKASRCANDRNAPHIEEW